MNMCLSATNKCSALWAAAHDNNVDLLRVTSLDELVSQKPPCCYAMARVEHLTCMGGAFEVFCVLVEKGLLVDTREHVRVDFRPRQNLVSIAEASGCSRLVALLKRGVLKVPPPWATVRLLFIGRLDPGCTFHGIPKDVARLIGQSMVREIPFLKT